MATPDSSTRQRLAAYRDLLLDWNTRFNLTAVVDPDAVDRRLIADSLRLLPTIDAYIQSRTQSTQSSVLASPRLLDSSTPRLLDLGTGAGIPGLVLAIARPDLAVTLADATAKKVRFLHHAIDELAVVNARAIHARAEELGRDLDHRGQYDLVTARAVAALPVLLELAMPLLWLGGWALFPKGADIDDELAEGRRAAAILGARIVQSSLLPPEPGLPSTRLVVAIKMGATPERYPRRSGVPTSAPLGRVAT